MVHKIRLIIEKWVSYLAVFLMLALVILSFLQVMLRNFFSIGFSSIEELMRNGVLWIAFTGAILTTLRGRHIAFDILPRFLKDKKKIILDWILSISASATCLFLAWLGINYLCLEIEMESQIGGFCPAWIVEIIIPVGFVLLSIVFPLRVLDRKYDEAAK